MLFFILLENANEPQTEFYTPHQSFRGSSKMKSFKPFQRKYQDNNMELTPPYLLFELFYCFFYIEEVETSVQTP